MSHHQKTGERNVLFHPQEVDNLQIEKKLAMACSIGKSSYIHVTKVVRWLHLVEAPCIQIINLLISKKNIYLISIFLIKCTENFDSSGKRLIFALSFVKFVRFKLCQNFLPFHTDRVSHYSFSSNLEIIVN